MIIHIWMHWFWITTLVCKGFLLSLSRHVLCSSSLAAEAGLPGTSFILSTEDYGVLRGKLLNYTSQDVEIRLRRTVEDEDVMEETTTTVPVPESNETVSNETASGESDVYHGPVSSDVEDTYNGATGDGFQYPLKKYTKYTKYGKLKGKGKVTEEEAESNVTVAAGNETIWTGATMAVENATAAAAVVVVGANETEVVVPEEGTLNQTASPGRNATAEEELASEVNVTEGQTPAEGTVTEANLTVESKLDESVVHTTVEPFIFNNRVAAATSSETRERLSQPSLDAGSITGITLGIVVISGFIGAISFVLYRRRYLNKPQALNDKCSNLDSSGYIDDTSLRENSEEMYSLDNDSFLNSLEAMTIQNYWTENVKHTKL